MGILVTAGILALVVLALQGVTCWYFKINERLGVQKEIRDHLKAIGAQLSAHAALEGPAAETATGPHVWYVDADQIEVVETPGAEATVVNTLRRDRRVTVYEYDRGWGSISRPGEPPQWVRTYQLRKEEESS